MNHVKIGLLNELSSPVVIVTAVVAIPYHYNIVANIVISRRSFSRQTTQADPMYSMYSTCSINIVRVISRQSQGRLETTLTCAPNDFGSNYTIITGDPYPLAAFFDGHRFGLCCTNSKGQHLSVGRTNCHHARC